MPDKNSIYTLNKKDPEAIIYTDADRHIIRLTRADFDTEADFLKWKAWSDANYHEEEKRDHVEGNHTLPLDERAGAADGPEIIIEQRIEKQDRDQYAAETVIRIKGQLTEKWYIVFGWISGGLEFRYYPSIKGAGFRPFPLWPPPRSELSAS